MRNINKQTKMPTLFGFGKRRRRSASKASKPPSKLLKLCRKYRVKTTAKRGGKNCYRPTTMLKRLCLKKARALKKKLMRSSSFGKKRCQWKRKSAFGSSCGGAMEFGKGRRPSSAMEFGKGRRRRRPSSAMEFGKRRRVNKTAAMKAFKTFYRRHCGARGSRFGFGSGGNPPLWQSMGYEFCSDGGGVLGANSTGLYPSPCMPKSGAKRSAPRRPGAAPRRPAGAARRPSGAPRRPASAVRRPASASAPRRPASAIRRPASASAPRRPASASAPRRPASAIRRPASVAMKKAKAAMKKAAPRVSAAIKRASPKIRAAMKQNAPAVRAAVRKAAPKIKAAAMKSAPKIKAAMKKAPPAVRAAMKKLLRRKSAFGYYHRRPSRRGYY